MSYIIMTPQYFRIFYVQIFSIKIFIYYKDEDTYARTNKSNVNFTLLWAEEFVI